MNTNICKKISMILTLAGFLSISAVAFADVTQGSGTQKDWHHHFWKEMKEVRAACAQANGFALPAKGSGERLSSADHTALRACVGQFHQHVQTCLQNGGISKPQPGQRPTEANIAAFKQCRTTALADITAGSPSASK